MITNIEEFDGTKTIAIDFDGVISEYNGWRGKGVFGPPTPGVLYALTQFKETGYIVIVYTCRLEIDLIKEYMEKHNLPYDYINFSPVNIIQDLHPAKVAADVYIDDKGLRFIGSWSLAFINEVLEFKPWWRENNDKN